MKCVKCNNNYSIKNGKRGGKQSYLCKACGRQFTGDKEYIENEKKAALTLAIFGLSARKIALMLSYSHPTILNWIREFEKNRTTFSEDSFLELDELCDFLSKRTKNPQGRRFNTMQDALTWNVENEMSKHIEKVLASLTVEGG